MMKGGPGVNKFSQRDGARGEESRHEVPARRVARRKNPSSIPRRLEFYFAPRLRNHSGTRPIDTRVIRVIRNFLILAAAALWAGCATGPAMKPVDLTEPGWAMREAQAVWKPNRKAPEIGGELLLASHPDGRSLAQFTKTPLPFVVAQTTTNRWRIQFVPKNLSFAGSGRGPNRLIWLHLGYISHGQPPPRGWVLDKTTAEDWKLANGKSGETLEIHFQP